MKFCPFCGKELKEHMKFCPFCGKALIADQCSNDAAPQSAHTQTYQQTDVLLNSKPRSFKKVFLPLLGVLIIALAVIFLLKPFGDNFSEDPDAIQKAAASVVLLECYDYYGNPYAGGSGFAAFGKDIIITNHHVISGDVYRIEATREDGSTFSIDSVVAYDKEKDFAILRAPDHNLPLLDVGNSANLKKGEKTVAIGSPTGYKNTVSTGIFSNYLDVGTYLQLLSTASISPGSSGGALFNDHGEVIGITSGEYTNGNDLYYCIPIQYVQEAYENRTPENEILLTEFYNLSDHPYSTEYILAYGSKLHNQTVTTYGYISGMDANIYLVSSPELVVHIDVRNSFDITSAMMLTELRKEKYALEIDTTKNRSLTNGLKTGDTIVVSGTVMYYSSSDIRLIATEIYN